MKRLIRQKSALARVSLFLLCIFLVASVSLSSGCANTNNEQSDPPSSNLDLKEKPTTITLYFSDSQAEKLLSEERDVILGGKPLPEVIVNELVKGPENSELSKTIPEGTKLLSLKVTDGLAQVDFSQEIQTKHWGGSAGETMTIYSIVNTLTQLEEIKEVKFLVEGKTVESLAGHYDLSRPIAPNQALIGK